MIQVRRGGTWRRLAWRRRRVPLVEPSAAWSRRRETSMRWMDRSTCWKRKRIAVAGDGLFCPPRIALGFDARESTPGCQRQAVVLNAETRSFQRAAVVLQEVFGFSISANMMERIWLDAGCGLRAAHEQGWTHILTGEVTVPEVAVVSYDGGRIRTREANCGSGVHLHGQGWNETKNAMFVSATSTVSAVAPEPHPPACFVAPKHVAQLTAEAQIKENAASDTFLQRHEERCDEQGRRFVIRNGRLPEREILAGAGPIPVQQPRVRDKSPDQNQRVVFTSQILPPYWRKSRSPVDALPRSQSI
jgi:hypothetical protein